jgi:hypothetical protein
MERRECQDSNERSDRALSTEATLRNEPIEKADSAEPTALGQWIRSTVSSQRSRWTVSIPASKSKALSSASGWRATS